MEEMDSILKKSIELGKKEAQEAFNKCDGSYVGISTTAFFIHEGLKYKTKIDAFWEKSFHFDVLINGVDNDYENIRHCVRFWPLNNK